MCGIAGVVADGPGAAPRTVLDGMARAISYRGRDGEGSWTDGAGTALLHSRLAIIDPAHGSQPMSGGTDGLIITFGGEIHNYRELRADLEARGARFRTATDSEVLLEGYRQRGSDFCNDLVGIFAFAIWDEVRQELFLARDRMGEKPLFWFRSPGAFWFASTSDAFAASRSWRGSLSRRGMAEYLAAGSTRGATSIWSGVEMLPAGCHAVVRRGSTTPVVTQYWQWDLSTKDARSSDSDLVDEYGHVLGEAVRLRLIADVPTSISFSGGVDSGTIAALASQAGVPVGGVTVDASDGDRDSAETSRARMAAMRIGMPWRHVDYAYQDTYCDDLVRVVSRFDQPLAAMEAVQVAVVASAMRSDGPVALLGNSADELLLGYRGDERLRRLELLRRASRGVGLGRYGDPLVVLARRLQSGVVTDAPDLEADFAATIDEFGSEVRRAGAYRVYDLKTYFALRWGSSAINMSVPDIVGLEHGVEFRSPFLDHRVVELAARLPIRMRVPSVRDGSRNKLIAKLLYERLVGRDLAWAPKMNMGANVRWDLAAGTSPVWRAMIESAFDEVRLLGLDTSAAQRAWSDHAAAVTSDRAGPDPRPWIRTTMLGLWLSTRSRRPSIAW